MTVSARHSIEGAHRIVPVESIVMRWTVVVPGALLPSPIAADVLAGATAPWLQQALARAQTEAETTFGSGGAPHLSWLWQQFGGNGEPVTAPYALRAVDADADPGTQCWHVDPVHFAFARDHLLVAPLDEPLAADEAIALARHLRAVLHEHATVDAQPSLHLHDGQWLLTLARPWSIQATSLDGALGRSAHEHWASGADAAAWRRVLTEVQMRWHQEQFNEMREARGRRAVNALWLHGGGIWAALPARPFTAVASEDAVLRGWALASGLSRAALRDDDASVGKHADAVSIRRDLLIPAQFESWAHWLERLTTLDAALRSLHEACLAAGGDELALVLCGRRQVRVAVVRRSDSWRLWRRTPLAPLFAEAE